MKSTFKFDLEKEQKLSVLLDSYYNKHLRNYDFERVQGLGRQIQGIDVIFRRKSDGREFFIDEKAQLDYVNEDLPTFAFELLYIKKDIVKKGWLFGSAKKTDFYSLVTAVYSDEPHKYTSCKITLVNRKKLISLLESRNLPKKSLERYVSDHFGHHAKLEIPQLNSRTEGYFYFSTQNKAEKPVNLILKLDFLIENGVARRLV